MAQGPSHEVTDTGTTFPNENEYVDFKDRVLPVESFKIYREGDIDWWIHDDGQYLACSDVNDDWWEVRETDQSENVLFLIEVATTFSTSSIFPLI